MFKRTFRRAAAALLACVAACASAVAQDWPQWRGPGRDGSAAAFKTPKQWPEKLTLKWRVAVGHGAASPVLAGNLIFGMSAKNKGQYFCLDTAQDLGFRRSGRTPLDATTLDFRTLNPKS